MYPVCVLMTASRCLGQLRSSFKFNSKAFKRSNGFFIFLETACRAFSSPVGKGAEDNLSISGEPINPMHGSNHWSFERAISVATLGLIGTAAVYPHSIVNFALGAVIPVHLHIGFGAIITDYLPHRKFPVVYRFARGVLYASTALTFYGLYRFNTEDVGIIDGVKALWSAKQKSQNEANK